MTPTPTPNPGADLRELRVLGGPQRGAALPLEPDRTYTVGTAFGADVVLRAAAGTAEGSASIRVQPDGLWLQAGTGEVAVDGAALAAGESRVVRWGTPWQIGDTVLAAGPQGDWESAPSAMPAPEAAVSPSTARATSPLPSPARLRGWGRRLATGGAAVVVASLSMWALAMAISPAAPRPDALAQRAQATLHAAGMTAVTVTLPAGQAEPLVEGYLDTHAQRTRAESLLAAQGLRPRFAVWINENLAQAVQDVYRVHGISAEVQTLGPGRVRVHTALADATTLASVEKAVRRDVQGLNQLDTRNAPPPGMPSPVPTLDDPGKRVASIVTGEEPYVATQDGTRYFIGALLPTGHRILAIADGRVELEREGQSTALTF
jgi:type III secretion protein D